MANDTINLEAGMPTVAVAHQKLDIALQSAKAKKLSWLKIVHGYGSTGKGGAIKRDVHTTLCKKKDSGYIKSFVAGEDFTPFDTATRSMLIKFPTLAKDSDYSRHNNGITIVFF